MRSTAHDGHEPRQHGAYTLARATAFVHSGRSPAVQTVARFSRLSEDRGVDAGRDATTPPFDVAIDDGFYYVTLRATSGPIVHRARWRRDESVELIVSLFFLNSRARTTRTRLERHTSSEMETD